MNCFTCQEEKTIALLLLAHVDLDDCPNGCLQVVLFRLRSIEDLDGMGPAGNVHQGRVVKVVLEFAGVEGGAHDDQFQVGPGKNGRWSIILSITNYVSFRL